MSLAAVRWRCRLCNHERYHAVSVKKPNGTMYTTSFYACSNCSVMFLNPAYFNKTAHLAGNADRSRVVTPLRLRTVALPGDEEDEASTGTSSGLLTSS